VQVERIFEKVGKRLRRQSDDNDSVTMCDCVGLSRVNLAVRAWLVDTCVSVRVGIQKHAHLQICPSTLTRGVRSALSEERVEEAERPHLYRPILGSSTISQNTLASAATRGNALFRLASCSLCRKPRGGLDL
jgi:hypothetical protein